MKLRWGICSAGLIANDFVVGLSTLSQEEHTVVAIAETWVPENARELAKRYNIGVVYEKYEDIAADPNIDIVYIAVVNQFHLPLCKLFLNHGKNILCEKPLGLNKKESREIIELAKEKNVFFMEGWWSRFFPAAAKIRDILTDGVIGEVKFMQCGFGFPMSFKERLHKKEFGGGAIMDIGIYVLNLALMVFGQAPLACSGKGFLGDTGVDETCVITMLFPDKGAAALTVSIAAKLPNEVNIQGSKGHIKIPNPFWSPTKLEITTRTVVDEKDLFNTRETTEILEFPLIESNHPQNFPNAVGMRYEAEAVRQCIIKGMKECPLVSHKESLLMAEILESLRHNLGYVLDGDDVDLGS